MSALVKHAAVSYNAYTYTFKGPISGLALDCSFALTLQAGVKAAGGGVQKHRPPVCTGGFWSRGLCKGEISLSAMSY